jgi:hypothetical protein
LRRLERGWAGEAPFRLGGALIELHDDGLTVTRFGARQVDARPHHTGEYQQRAFDLGYGADVARMSRDHELCHSLLAHLLELPASPTLMGIATGKHMAKHWRREEAAVLGLQGFARAAGADLQAIALKLSQQE